MQSSKLKQAGFGLLEVLVGLGILGVAFFTLVSVSRSVLELSRVTSQAIQADFLIEEGVEAMRSIRDAGWATYITPLSGTNYLRFVMGTSTGSWQTTTTPEIINNIYYRSVAVASVERNSSSQDIVTSGGTTDSSTKKFTVSVSWRALRATTTRSVSFYLTNYFND